MEKLENDEAVPDPGRRHFLRTLGVAGVALFSGGISEATAQDQTPARYPERWGYSLEEMKEIYEHEYNGEQLLKNRFQKREGKIIATVDGKELVVPEEFVGRILRHLTQMIDAGTLKYIFRLDAFHGHPYIDKKLCAERYGHMPRDIVKETEILVTDPDVEILYHNAEHLGATVGNIETESLLQKRNVVGRVKNAAIEVLPLPNNPAMPTTTAHNRPDWSQDFHEDIRFVANKDGLFAIRIGEKEIRLDLSLDDNTYY